MRKRCGKLLSLVLTMAMVLSMAAMTAFAAGEAAETGGTQYATLQEAINHANGGTVRLLRDVEESVTVAEGVSVTLDLGGFTLTGKADHTIVNRGVLTVTGNGTVVNNLGGKAALYTAPTGKSVLSGGTFTGNSWYVIKNLGEMEIDGASVKQEHTGSSGIANGYYGNLATDCNETYPSSAVVKLTIKKGTFNGGMNTVKNDDFGVLVIEGGSFSNTAGPTILNWHEATINGGTFTGTAPDKSVIANGYLSEGADKGKLTINGGTFTGSNDGTGVLFGYGEGSKQGGKFAVAGGDFVGDPGISAQYPYMPEISGGSYSQKPADDMIADDSAVAKLTSGQSGIYYIGTSGQVADKVNGAAKGDIVEVLAGDVKLSVAEGVHVKNTGNGVVEANGQTVAGGAEVVTAHVHKAVKVEAKEAEIGKTGNIAYWYCEACGKYFSDEALTKEITKEATIIPAKEAPSDQQTEKTPATGDMTMTVLWSAVMILAAGSAYGFKKKISR